MGVLDHISDLFVERRVLQAHKSDLGSFRGWAHIDVGKKTNGGDTHAANDPWRWGQGESRRRTGLRPRVSIRTGEVSRHQRKLAVTHSRGGMHNSAKKMS